jgi:hypothetical protein
VARVGAGCGASKARSGRPHSIEGERLWPGRGVARRVEGKTPSGFLGSVTRCSVYCSKGVAVGKSSPAARASGGWTTCPTVRFARSFQLSRARRSNLEDEKLVQRG